MRAKPLNLMNPRICQQEAKIFMSRCSHRADENLCLFVGRDGAHLCPQIEAVVCVIHVTFESFHNIVVKPAYPFNKRQIFSRALADAGAHESLSLLMSEIGPIYVLRLRIYKSMTANPLHCRERKI